MWMEFALLSYSMIFLEVWGQISAMSFLTGYRTDME